MRQAKEDVKTMGRIMIMLTGQPNATISCLVVKLLLVMSTQDRGVGRGPTGSVEVL